jgi:hypothetical protein
MGSEEHAGHVISGAEHVKPYFCKKNLLKRLWTRAVQIYGLSWIYPLCLRFNVEIRFQQVVEELPRSGLRYIRRNIHK